MTLRPIRMVALAATVLLFTAPAWAQDGGAGSVPLQEALTPATAQSNVPPAARQAESAVEDAVRRFRVGLVGGVAVDPELIEFGAHAAFGPIFTRGLEFRPGIEFGLGEVTTAFGINLDVLYVLGDRVGDAGWAPYLGAGPNFALSHQSFATDDDDDDEDDGNRFDFSDTDFVGGFNFIAGARRPNGLFMELRATAYGVSNVRLLVGFNF